MSLRISLGKQSLLTSYCYKQEYSFDDEQSVIISTDFINYTDIFDIIYSNKNEEDKKEFETFLDETDFNVVSKNDELHELLRKQFEKTNFIPIILIISDQKEQKNSKSLLNFLDEEVKKIPLKFVTLNFSNSDFFFDSFCLHENLKLLEERKSVYYEIDQTFDNISGKNAISRNAFLIYESQIAYIRNHLSIPDYFDILNLSGFLPYHNYYFSYDGWDDDHTLINTVGDLRLDYYNEGDILNICQIVFGNENSYKFLYNKRIPWVFNRWIRHTWDNNYPHLIKLNGFHENLKISNLINNMKTSTNLQKEEILETLYKIQN